MNKRFIYIYSIFLLFNIVFTYLFCLWLLGENSKFIVNDSSSGLWHLENNIDEEKILSMRILFILVPFVIGVITNIFVVNLLEKYYNPEKFVFFVGISTIISTFIFGLIVPAIFDYSSSQNREEATLDSFYSWTQERYGIDSHTSDEKKLYSLLTDQGIDCPQKSSQGCNFFVRNSDSEMITINIKEGNLSLVENPTEENKELTLKK